MTKLERLQKLINDGEKIVNNAFEKDDGIIRKLSRGTTYNPIIRTYVDDDEYQQWHTEVKLFLERYNCVYGILVVSVQFDDTNYNQIKKQIAKLKALLSSWIDAQVNVSDSEFCFLSKNVVDLYKNGHFQEAVFEAYKFIEIEIKKHTQINQIGENLIREAFKPKVGVLTNKFIPENEQKSLADLFSGANGFIRNPKAHNNIQVTKEVAYELLHMSNYLLRIVNGQYAQRA